MSTPLSPCRPVKPAFLLGLALLMEVSLPGRALANGGTPRLVEAPAGPYLVSAWTQPEPPRVGRIDVGVGVMRPSTGEPVLDAKARLRAEPRMREGPTSSARLVRGAGRSFLLYHGELEVPAAGPWRLTVEVEGHAGRGQASFELDVLPPPPMPRAWLLSAVGLFAMGTAWWLWVRARRRHKSGYKATRRQAE